MASHLNAHNMPGPDPGAGSSVAPASRKWLWALAAILAFFLLDRASLLLLPAQYHSVPDVDHYHTLYYSLKFQRFDQIKDRLETIVLGDSRARHGVDPTLFDDRSDVTAFNFAPASGGIEFTDTLVRQYLCDLPSLRTIVWGVSPRIFNQYWPGPISELFVQSKGHQSDRLAADKAFSRTGIKAAVRLRTHRIFSRLSAAFAHRSKLKSILLDCISPSDTQQHFHTEQVIQISDSGYMELPQSQVVDVSDPAEVRKNLKELQAGRFKLDQTRLQKFRDLIALLHHHNIRLVCFVPPMHHSLTQSPAADVDGTPDDDYNKLISTLKALETQYGNYHFIDLHQAGQNGFADLEYGDFEHLNRAGSRRLSQMIAEHLERICAKPLTPAKTIAEEPTTTWQLQPDEPPPSGAGNQDSASPPDGDNEPPEIVSQLDDLDNYMVGAFPPDNRPLIWAEYSDEGSGIDAKSVKLFMDGKDITAKCKISPSKISYKPPKTLKAPHLYEFKVIISDKAGNQSELIWEILLKPC
ncbi:MAG: SGNH/GDSL hydrolase family protein [Planctomycetota bacterium]|jgi:hypothetical protein